MAVFQFIIIPLLGAMVGAVLTSIEIPILKHRQFQQFIREEGPASHLKKEGTPTMGGIAIYATIIMTCLFTYKLDKDLWVIVLVGLLFGLIGFLDDYIKVTAKHNLGLRAWQKLVLQILFGLLFGFYLMYLSPIGSEVWIPFLNIYVDFGFFFPIFIAFVLVAMANAVNLTDGMDGLCSGVVVVVSIFGAITANHFAIYPSAIYLLATAGALIGFLFFNYNPAKVFMGDTGSMALGGGITAAIIMTKAELLIPFAGLVFVLEALSVILQVGYFKATHGKRIFRMAPLHHHFEEGGMKEVHVVWMFWIFALLCCVASYGILRIGA